ncbi:MAG: hypothetical protein DRP42_04665 [Tenericutes bacterium]|nr:MAG: hypothetical protein DRP42_04665 [Mycoplasmatota bacterium]
MFKKIKENKQIAKDLAEVLRNTVPIPVDIINDPYLSFSAKGVLACFLAMDEEEEKERIESDPEFFGGIQELVEAGHICPLKFMDYLVWIE